ncbi:hypothetical protein ACRE_003430 [Hapsidospora chrysogenum ATCC 11550]|uniref:Ribosome biogenesis protein SLX9 n=1 Tax=Hapsidospora chrysogenum (strain ATCC 11550 / CBS 779.69 / DSM 880 / IAM 14645 / JCM 23072 / IMI 49137) TaxID=857340 RepID=A0A086TH25_HAPC1|nr:hypothetical protein ACRE_003430 [Hapsidospora chrysogenum ATCC 11550]
MAPTAPPTNQQKPSARTLRHQRITGQIHPLLPPKLFRPDAAVSDSFISSKRDKRLIRHSTFLSRVQSSSDKISKSGHRRRRRPANKIASLDSLADALPELEEQVEAGKVRHKSLKSRKGALKRKEKVVKGEMQRFGVSMAKLAGTPGASADNAVDSAVADGDEMEARSASQEQQKTAEAPSAGSSAPTANRWAVLRGYISATMEQNPAFANKN